ncbi:MAG: sulfite exporter TauE/SafE family protein [Gemmatimonadetes bacterium]|jgi:uncharacterized protein|nr:sulfite exporter TauE/SafE family protein [Gemmatimonadota bacterium]MBT7860240.1 sulfite exporter TauE/SafE family protein [Gemmatimonadota bacterium]
MPVDPTDILLNLILGAAAFVSAVTGFGYALIAVPFLVLLFPPTAAVPVVLISWYPLALVLVWECRRAMSGRRILRLLLFGVIGMPVGVYGLASLPSTTMQSIIGCTTLLATVALAFRPGAPFVHEGRALAGAGLLSGVIGGGSGMTGPPIVLLGLKQGWEHRGFRADLIGYFFLLHGFMALAFGQFGLLDGETLRLTVLGLPGVISGSAVGLWVKGRVDAQTYRRLAIGLIAIGGVSATLMR